MEEKQKSNMRMEMPEAAAQMSETVLEPLKKLNLMDDFLFDVATVDLEVCKIIIELSLGIRIRNIQWKEGQKVVHNLPGKRGIRMDFKIHRLKTSEEMGVTYMKMEERDRLIRKEGELEGRKEGEKTAETRMAKLIEHLLDEGKEEELQCVAADEEYRRKMFDKYGL